VTELAERLRLYLADALAGDLVADGTALSGRA